jgi:hypothetical protein
MTDLADKVWLLGQLRRIWLTPTKTMPDAEVCWCRDGEAIYIQKVAAIAVGVYRPREANEARLSVGDYRLITGLLAESAI